MSHALDMLLAGNPIQHRPQIPEGWSLCSVCGSTRSSDYHVELPDGWEPIGTAPKNATWIQVLMMDGKEQRAHWAEDLSGEEQPCFRGWFVQGDGYFAQIDEPIGWKPEPHPSEHQYGTQHHFEGENQCREKQQHRHQHQKLNRKRV